MREVLFIFAIVISLLTSCGSNENPIEKAVKNESLIIDSVSLVIIEENYSLEDSVSFNELVREIVLNKELNSNNEVPSKFVTDRIYKFVYQTPDSIIPLSRKMDLIQMLVYYYKNTTDDYIEFISHKIEAKNDEVTKRPFLLLPFLYTNKISPSIIKCILKQDSIQAPKEYNEYSNNVKTHLTALPRNNLTKAMQTIKARIYFQNPNTRKFLSMGFQKKYNQIPAWTNK